MLHSILFWTTVAIYLSIQVPLYLLAVVLLVWHAEGRQRLGLGHLPVSPKRPVWLHGASIGEWSALQPIVAQLRSDWVGTYTSRNGRLAGVASERGSLAPIDLWPAVLLFIVRLRPAAYVLAEVDLWPTTLLLVRFVRIPLLWVNIRSDRSMGKILVKYPWLYRYMLSNTVFAHSLDQQTQATVSSVLSAESSVGINLKAARNIVETQKLPKKPVASQVLLLASIHVDEVALLKNSLRWLAEDQGRFLYVVPRHIKYAEQMENLAKQADASTNQYEVIKSFGLLAGLCAVADFVIVGGTTNTVGGHNPIEAAVFGAKVYTGPSIFGQLPAVELLQVCENIRVMQSVSEIFASIGRDSRPKLDTSCLQAKLADARSLARSIATRIDSVCGETNTTL